MGRKMSNNSLYCYWEKQGRDKLCAIHSLNVLMQKPAFSEIELAQIAHQLDEEERAILGGHLGSGNDGGSNNVDPDGNFSLGVMEKAIEKFQYRLENLDKPETRRKIMANPQSEQAYVCNSHARSHWYTIRKVRSKWYDLDSLKPAPTFISDHSLAQFLERTMQSGFTVFVVRDLYSRDSANGPPTPITLPEPDKFLHGKQLMPHQMYITDYDIERMVDDWRREQDKEASDAQRIGGAGGDEDAGTPGFGSILNAGAGKQKPVETDWSKLGAGNTLGGGAGGGATSSSATPASMDDDLAAAIAASLGDIQVPAPAAEPTEGGIMISFKHKSDEPVKRTFAKTATLLEVFQYCEYAQLKESKFASVPAHCPLVSNSFSLLKPDFPKKKKYVKDGSGRITLDGNDVTNTSLADGQFASREALTLQVD